MLVGVPIDADAGLDSPVCGHFGHAAFYAFVDSENLECTIVPNGSSHQGGTKLPPEWLSERGVEILLCQGLGRRAIQLCEEFGIAVYLGRERTVREFLAALKENRVQSASLEDGCAH